MDIKTADRLQELRKNHGFSQEALSEKLGVSRQAISKWERGESSPDTDNLIALANIYGITLDDILNPEKDIKKPQELPLEPPMPSTHFGEEKDELVSNLDSAQPPIPEEKKETPKKKKGVYDELGKALLKFPFALIVVAIYVVFNIVFHSWHPGWIMFILVPIYYHLAGACFAKSKKGFLFALPIPEIVILAYLALGFIKGLWLPALILFIVVPLFYWGVAFYKKSKKE